MDFWQTVLVLVRRWYVTVPAFVAAVAVAAASYAMAPVRYESGSVLVLTTPLQGGTQMEPLGGARSVTNPLLNFAQGLSLTASILIQELSSPETVQALGVEPGGTTGYEVNNGTTNPELLESGPFIFVGGTGATPQAAQDITARVSAQASEILTERQHQLGAPPSTHIALQTVVQPTVGRPLTGSPMRAAAAAGALAALASLICVYGVESIATHRRRRRAVVAPTTAAGPRAAPRPSAVLR